MLVIVDAPLPDERAEQIRRLDPKIELAFVPERGQPLPLSELRQAEVIYTSKANFNPADAPLLRWVQTDSAALQSIVGTPVMRSSVPVANATGAYSVAVAECALGMLLALTRRVALGVRFQLEQRWPDDFAPWAGVDLYGLTVGIVGYGSIGRQFARLAQALGMQVLAYKRRPEIRRDESYLLPGTGDPAGEIPRAWFGPGQLTDMLRQSDVALITLPSTPGTDGQIGAAELAALPPHAWLCSVGRGAVIDEQALADALRRGALAGAALDVFVEEPLPPSSRLWGLSNVLILPHIASWTRMQAHRASGVLLENIRRHLGGEPLVNVIDKELLY